MKIINFLEGDTDLLRNLPQDMMREILGRLSIRDIMKCKCVCKSWRNLIERGEFVVKVDNFRVKCLEIQTLKSKGEELEMLLASNGVFGSKEWLRLEIWMAKDLKILRDLRAKKLEIQPCTLDEVLRYMDLFIQELKNTIEELEMLLVRNEVNGAIGESKNRWLVVGDQPLLPHASSVAQGSTLLLEESRS